MLTVILAIVAIILLTIGIVWVIDKFVPQKIKPILVIEKLKDIRDSQLAYKTVNGKFTDNWDELVKFIETGKFTITQRRDSTVLDAEMTRRFGVDMTKDIVVIDTLGTVPVKDSLFGADTRYKTMMNVPVGEPGAKFKLQAGKLDEISVFEASVDKSVLLFDQDKNLLAKEKEVVSVDGVNGPMLKVGSMTEVNTNGNWPKNYSKEQ